MAHKSMELREWAIFILGADRLEDKLYFPGKLTDDQPGPPMIWKDPVRPSSLTLRPRRTKEEKLPSFQMLKSPDHRAACLHRFAGHELLAVEMMAYVLLKFPDAPKHFRRGVAHTLQEEQEHVHLYCEHLKLLGAEFGDMPLFRHFWNHVPYLNSPLEYVSVMSLTFEMANLDFAPHYRDAFSHHGDPESAKLMQRILDDEISHVSFGWHWLKKLKSPEMSDWDVWRQSLTPLLTPRRARGFQLNEEPRLKAGVSKEWIHQLKTQAP